MWAALIALHLMMLYGFGVRRDATSGLTDAGFVLFLPWNILPFILTYILPGFDVAILLNLFASRLWGWSLKTQSSFVTLITVMGLLGQIIYAVMRTNG
jgi:hypothetical protein